MSAQGEYKPSLNIPFLPGKMLSTLRLIEELKQKSRLLNRALYGPCQLTLSRPGFKKNISHFSTKSALLAIQIALYFFFIFVILLAHLKKKVGIFTGSEILPDLYFVTLLVLIAYISVSGSFRRKQFFRCQKHLCLKRGC